MRVMDKTENSLVTIIGINEIEREWKKSGLNLAEIEIMIL